MSLKINSRTLYIKKLTERLFISSQNAIPLSTDIAGIEIRMCPPLIKNNRTVRIWPFPGHAKVYCLTIAVSDIKNQMAGHIDLNTFQGINDNEYLPLDKTLYYWEPSLSSTAPSQVHILTSIIKSKEALRNTATVLEQAKSDDDYKLLVESLSLLQDNAHSFSSLAGIVIRLAGIVGSYLGRVHDKPLATVVNSFTRIHGDWDNVGIKPVCIKTRNVDFNFELIIRDHLRGKINPDMKPL